MPDVTFSDALEEALASAPLELVIIDTVEISYTGSVEQPLRLYNGNRGDRYDQGAPFKNFRLEDDAPRNAGQVVEFIGLAFAVKLPDLSTDPTAKGQLLIDGVGREVIPPLLTAISNGANIEVIYRPYLQGMELDGPQQLPPITFAIANVSISGLQVSADIVLPTHGTRRFPRELYTLTRFPTLGQ